MIKTIGILLILTSIILLSGCGGSGGGGTGVSPIVPTPTISAASVKYEAYVYGPSGSSRLSSVRATSGLKPEEGLIIINKPSQAPQGYKPVVNCLIKLQNGKSTSTNTEGWFGFNEVTPSNDPNGTIIIIDPENSSSHNGFGSIAMDVIIPDSDTTSDFKDLIIKPEKLTLPIGGYFLYQVYGFTSTGESFEVPPEQVEWFVNSSSGNIGSMSPDGLFEATAAGTGKVLAKVTTSSGEKTATGSIQVVSEGTLSSIRGTVYRTVQGTQVGVSDVLLFTSEMDLGASTDEKGYYEFTRVPSGVPLTLNIMEQGRIVKVINDITVQEGEVKVMDISLDDVSPEKYFEGMGTVKYDTGLEGGTYIFESFSEPEPWPVPDPNYPEPIPLSNKPIVEPEPPIEPPVEPNFSPPSPPVTVVPITQEKFALIGMENFPEVKDKLINNPNKSFEVYVSGKISDGSGITMMKTLQLDSIKLFSRPDDYDGIGEVYFSNDPNGKVIKFESIGPGGFTNLFILLGVEKVAPDLYSKIVAGNGTKYLVEVRGNLDYDQGGIIVSPEEETNMPEPVNEFPPETLDVTYIAIVDSSQLKPVDIDGFSYFNSYEGGLYDKEGDFYFMTLTSSSSLGETYILKDVPSQISTELKKNPSAFYSAHLKGKILNSNIIPEGKKGSSENNTAIEMPPVYCPGNIVVKVEELLIKGLENPVVSGSGTIVYTTLDNGKKVVFFTMYGDNFIVPMTESKKGSTGKEHFGVSDRLFNLINVPSDILSFLTKYEGKSFSGQGVFKLLKGAPEKDSIGLPAEVIKLEMVNMSNK